MYDGCEFSVGDLVEYRSWFDGAAGWTSVSGMIGIVLEVIEITSNENGFVYISKDEILYDVRVYWYAEEITEILPDMLLDHYTQGPRLQF